MSLDDDPFAGLATPATVWPPHITAHMDLVQGSDEWLEARLGMLTASEMRLIVTPTLKPASNEKERAHLFELAAQRITGFVEPHYISDDMLRGHEDEIRARELYATHFAPVQPVGFLVNTRHGFPIGYSPDGLVGADGLVECKSRRAKFQVQTILEHLHDDQGATIPADYIIQCQTGLLVAEREWLDLVSFSGGLPMCVLRVYPDPAVQDAILDAATAFEERIQRRLAQWGEVAPLLIPTERVVYEEVIL